jgi:hydrogenase nickel incorporation protein HypB
VKRVPLKQKVLKENDRIAGELRDKFLSQGTLALNLMSSPGSGKTSLLEQSLSRMPKDTRAAVLTGDIATQNDAERLRKFGSATQITTGGSCHLDAKMVERGLEEHGAAPLDILFDLLPHVPFDVDTVVENARRIHPKLEVIRTSCVTGQGIDEWISWLQSRLQEVRSRKAE